jgi:hypothetical protein
MSKQHTLQESPLPTPSWTAAPKGSREVRLTTLLLAWAVVGCGSSSSDSAPAPGATAGNTGGSGPVVEPGPPMRALPSLEYARDPEEGTISCKPVPVPATIAETGRVYHVSQARGSDENTGLEASPLKTISKAAELAMPGDTVLVHAGIYRERVAPPRGGLEGMPITYMAAPGEQVTIRGSEVWQPSWELVDALNDIYKASPDAAMFTDVPHVDGANPFEVPRAENPGLTLGQIFLDGEQMVEVNERDKVKLTNGGWHYVPAEKSIYLQVPLGKSLETSVVEITARRRVFAPHLRGLGYITVRGFTMEHAGNQYPAGFYVAGKTTEAQAGLLGLRSGHHWVVENNVIRFAKGLGLDIGNEGPGSGPDIEGLDNERKDVGFNVIRNNVISDNGIGGIMGWRHHDALIADNTFERNNLYQQGGPEPCGIKIHITQNVTVEGNLFRGNYADSMYFDNSNNNARISRNLFVGNRARAIFVEWTRTQRSVVDNNIVVDNLYNGIYSHNASHVLVAHNLVANTTGYDGYGSNGEGYLFRRVLPEADPTQDHRIFSNIFLNNAGGNLNKPYPCNGTGMNPSNRNVYAGAPTDRTLLVNAFCPAPTPFADVGLKTILMEDLGENAPASAFDLLGGAEGVRLTLPEWKAFWARHGTTEDANSLMTTTSSVKLDVATWTLTVEAGFDPKAAGSEILPEVTTDYFGQPIPADGSAVPGPSQALVQGSNQFVVRTCAPQ